MYEPLLSPIPIRNLHKHMKESKLVCLFLSLRKFHLQVWALAIGRKTEMLATGGSDAVVNLWFDSTASDKEEAFRKEVSQAHPLLGCLQRLNYGEASRFIFGYCFL